MKVVLDRSLFHPVRFPLELLALLALGWEKRHVLLCKPPYDPDGQEPVSVWVRSLSRRLSKQVNRVLEEGTDRSASLPPGTVQIQVHAEPTSDWAMGRLALPDALRLLHLPLRLLFENRQHDLQFLRRLCPPSRRQELDQAMEAGWIEAEHGGGISGIHTRLEELAPGPDRPLGATLARLRLWVLFDADADEKDRSRPSESSQTLKALCESLSERSPWPFGHHQLGRRAIENYLPTRLLECWVNEKSGDQKTRRRNKVQALCELEKQNKRARWQYPMKGGLIKDLPNAVREEVRAQDRDIDDGELDPLFRGFSRDMIRALKEGFGDKVSDLFEHRVPGVEDWFREESRKGPDDWPAVLDSLFARM